MSADPCPPPTDSLADFNNHIHKAIWRAMEEWEMSLAEVVGVLTLNIGFRILEAWEVPGPFREDEDKEEAPDELEPHPWEDDDDEDDDEEVETW